MSTGGITQAQGGLDAAAYAEAKKTSRVTSGKTVGSPELSEKAQKYYEQLQKKFSGYDFILVSEDKKAEAEANIAQYTNPNRMAVLINVDKLEKMAEDGDYRKKYEDIISGAAGQLKQLKTGLGARASKVKTFGMKFDDQGVMSLFAVIDASLAKQRERIKENAEEKTEEKKAEEKKAGKEKYVTLSAPSVEGLLQKIQGFLTGGKEKSVMTPEEKLLGGNMDYSL